MDEEEKKKKEQEVVWSDWERKYGKSKLQENAEGVEQGVRNEDNALDRFANRVRSWFRKK